MVDSELIEVALLLLGGVQLRMCCRQFGQVGIAAVGGEVEAFVGAYHAPAVGAQFGALAAVVCPTGCADDSGDIAER